MPIANKLGMEWQRREILFAWIAWHKELGDSPKAIETIRRVVALKADLHPDHLVQPRPITSKAPVIVCRQVADYLVWRCLSFPGRRKKWDSRLRRALRAPCFMLPCEGSVS
ncbi:MAG: hypothetical protein HYU83_01140 [Chloroflexi bacterium]|nr:hypothetical protein [Chloroflexota bacterium]